MGKRQKQSCLQAIAIAVLVSAAAAQVGEQNPSTVVSIDANANRHPIDPHIYGLSFATTNDLATTNFTLNRNGGNAASRYNWQLNAGNRGSDSYFESTADSSSTPGLRGDDFITTTRAANVGAEAMLTIPMIDYIAKVGTGRSSLASFSIAKYGPQTGYDPYNADAGNGVSTAAGHPNITGNDPNDASTPNSPAIQRAWVQHLVGNWGLATNGGQKYYMMGNEQSVWHSTHRDVHPNGATYSEMRDAVVAYAGAVRAVDPNAIIVGPEEWGWLALFFGGFDQQNGASRPDSDFNTHGQMYCYPWLLQQFRDYEQSTGTRLLDVLSVHYYPQDGSYSDDDSAAARLIRNQSTRSLWDPNYVDQSWINQVGVNGGKVNLIPSLKNWVDQFYPGLQTAITEYKWGDEANLNGATTQADVLGIFGREGLDMAARATVPANPSPTYLAMQIYRNYDGNLSTFGDTSVSTSVANPDNLSSFSAVRSSDGALTVMVINKQTGSTPVTINLANFEAGDTADAWQISSATQTEINHLGGVTVANNALATTVPSQSITLFIIAAGGATPLPQAPTGLTATAGTGTVTLTWNPSNGAAGYVVKRGGALGGPYMAIGTVASSTFTDTGLTDGTTYYYAVSAINSTGAGPISMEVAAVPLASPTFSSSAMTAPNPASPSENATITAAVTCTSGSLTDGVVQILVLDPTGAATAMQNFTAQNFTTNQLHTYSMALTPSAAGAYTVQVGVLSAASHVWSWNASAATMTVNSQALFTMLTATPSGMSIGGASLVAATVANPAAAAPVTPNTGLPVFDTSSGTMPTTMWTSQNFFTGQPQPSPYLWNPTNTETSAAADTSINVFKSTGVQRPVETVGKSTTSETATPSSPPPPTGLSVTVVDPQMAQTQKASDSASFLSRLAHLLTKWMFWVHTTPDRSAFQPPRDSVTSK